MDPRDEHPLVKARRLLGEARRARGDDWRGVLLDQAWEQIAEAKRWPLDEAMRRDADALARALEELAATLPVRRRDLARLRH